MSARWTNVVVDPAALDTYRQMCDARTEVPIPWPQLAATRLHVALVTDRAFPLRPTGLVHPRFTVTQHRPLRPGERFDLSVEVGGRRETPTGFEFDLVARVWVNNQCVWHSVAATYVRLRKGERRTEEAAAPDPAWATEQPLTFAANIGRKYAQLSGDWNPVHLFSWTARAFGYRSSIAHGWYLLARCLAAIGQDGTEVPTTVTFDLLRPVFLPCSLWLGSRTTEGGTLFSLYGPDHKPRVRGMIGPATEGAGQVEPARHFE